MSDGNKTTDLLAELRLWVIDHAECIDGTDEQAAELICRARDEIADLHRRLGILMAAIRQFADPANWDDQIACLRWDGKRHAIDYATEVLGYADS